MPYQTTVPAASGESDHREWRRDHKYTQGVAYDPRLTMIIGVCISGLMVLMTGAICWLSSTVVSYGQDLVGVKKDIAVLVARPVGVDRLEYSRDAQRWDEQIRRLNEERDRQRGH